MAGNKDSLNSVVVLLVAEQKPQKDTQTLLVKTPHFTTAHLHVVENNWFVRATKRDLKAICSHGAVFNANAWPRLETKVQLRY